MPEKKEVRDILDRSLYLDGPVDKAIEVLREKIKVLGKGKYLRYELDHLPREYEEGDDLVLVGVRLETAAEMTTRVQAEKEAQKLRDKWDREQFERLREKFEV